MKKYEYIVADEEAFTDFYNEFAPIICNYINKYVKNIEDAKEITADLFLSLPTKIQKYDSKKGRFEVWLFIVAKNMAIDFQRKKERRYSAEYSYCENQNVVTNSKKEQLLINDELESILTDDQYQIVLLKHYAGFHFKEIAKILSKSLSTIKREYKIAILKIKDYYVIKENTESEKKECSKVA